MDCQRRSAFFPFIEGKVDVVSKDLIASVSCIGKVEFLTVPGLLNDCQPIHRIGSAKRKGRSALTRRSDIKGFRRKISLRCIRQHIGTVRTEAVCQCTVSLIIPLSFQTDRTCHIFNIGRISHGIIRSGFQRHAIHGHLDSRLLKRLGFIIEVNCLLVRITHHSAANIRLCLKKVPFASRLPGDDIGSGRSTGCTEVSPRSFILNKVNIPFFCNTP